MPAPSPHGRALIQAHAYQSSFPRNQLVISRPRGVPPAFEAVLHHERYSSKAKEVRKARFTLKTTAVVVRNSAAPASARSPAPVHRRAIHRARHPAFGSRERIRIACSQGKFTAEL
jgi:hypothetical protein